MADHAGRFALPDVAAPELGVSLAADDEVDPLAVRRPERRRRRSRAERVIDGGVLAPAVQARRELDGPSSLRGHEPEPRMARVPRGVPVVMAEESEPLPVGTERECGRRSVERAHALHLAPAGADPPDEHPLEVEIGVDRAIAVEVDPPAVRGPPGRRLVVTIVGGQRLRLSRRGVDDPDVEAPLGNETHAVELVEESRDRADSRRVRARLTALLLLLPLFGVRVLRNIDDRELPPVRREFEVGDHAAEAS